MPDRVERNGRVGANSIRLHHDAWGRLVLTEPGGMEHVGVIPVRAFPLSAPGYGVALCDAGGHEVAWLEDLGSLPPPARRVLEEDLARREFVPQIERIVRITGATDPVEWEVETDRGATRFLLKSADDVHRLDDHQALVTDAHGIRYLIPDTRALDTGSRRLLERYL